MKFNEMFRNFAVSLYILADLSRTDRPLVVKSLLQLYQTLQSRATDYQILGTMLCQWCKNIAEVRILMYIFSDYRAISLRG